MFINKIPYNNLESLYKRIEKVKLSKPIDQFKTPEDIIDSLIRDNAESDINQVLQSIPSRSRATIKESDDFSRLEAFIRQHGDKKKEIISFFSKKGGRYSDYDDDEIIGEILEDLESIVNSKSIEQISILSKKSKDIIFITEDENILLVSVNYKGIVEIGSRYWCIVEDEDTFKDYIFEDGICTQLIMFFKNKDPFIDDKSVLGITWNLGENALAAAHWEDDSEYSISEKGINVKKYIKDNFKKISQISFTLHDYSESNGIFYIRDIYMPILNNKIEILKSGRKNNLDIITTFIQNWMQFISDSDMWGDDIFNSDSYKDIIGTIHKEGIKIPVNELSEVFHYGLKDICLFDKSFLKYNILLEDPFETFNNNPEYLKSFFNWLESNGYNLFKFTMIHDLINLNKIGFIDYGDIYTKKSLSLFKKELAHNDFMDMVKYLRDNNLKYLLDNSINCKDEILISLGENTKKYENEIKFILKDYKLPSTNISYFPKLLKCIVNSNNDEIIKSFVKGIIPKEISDSFDVQISKKIKKDINIENPNISIQRKKVK